MSDGTPPAPFRVGLTGGIASGKTTVADTLASFGAAVIDTDVIAREVVEPGQPALEEIRETFGDDVFDASGGLDRRALRNVIFNEADARRRLEAILHPRIRYETLRQADAAGGPYQVIVVPLLTSSELATAMDRILVVDCDEATQVERLLARDAETEAQARKILAAQASRDDRLAIADDVIENDGSLEELVAKLRHLHARYLELAAAHR